MFDHREVVPLRKITLPGASYPVWVEVYPERCPGCQQPWRGGHMAVGWLACGCNAGGRHRTLYCRDCATEVFLPPHHAKHGPWPPGSEPAAAPWYPPPLPTHAAPPPLGEDDGAVYPDGDRED